MFVYVLPSFVVFLFLFTFSLKWRLASICLYKNSVTLKLSGNLQYQELLVYVVLQSNWMSFSMQPYNIDIAVLTGKQVLGRLLQSHISNVELYMYEVHKQNFTLLSEVQHFKCDLQLQVTWGTIGKSKLQCCCQYCKEHPVRL